MEGDKEGLSETDGLIEGLAEGEKDGNIQPVLFFKFCDPTPAYQVAPPAASESEILR